MFADLDEEAGGVVGGGDDSRFVGVVLPRAEARMAAGALYCSEEHVRLGPSKGPR